MADAFAITLFDTFDLAPSWNIAPSQLVRIVSAHPQRKLHLARWGLQPPWGRSARPETTQHQPAGAHRAKIPGRNSGFINARSETAATKPTFHRALSRRRCLVPAEGYYEWQTTPNSKHPYYISLSNGAPLAFAGICEIGPQVKDEPTHLSLAILTLAADHTLSPIHDRMPAMPRPEVWDEWLSPNLTDPHDAIATLRAQRSDLVAYRVSAAVGNVANNYPQLADPL